jgi:hypothetical protein
MTAIVAVAGGPSAPTHGKYTFSTASASSALGRGLLDTSVFIASETGRPLDVDALPEEMAISPITVGELHAGVLATEDLDVCARRLATLESIADIELLPQETLPRGRTHRVG